MPKLQHVEKKVEDICTAYRFLTLSEAEVEDKTGKLLSQSNLSTYYKIRFFELSKVADQLTDTHHLRINELITCLSPEILQHADITNFTSELEQMQLKANITFSGSEIRLSLAKTLLNTPFIFEEGLLSYQSLKRLLVITAEHVHRRCHTLLSHLNEQRK